MENHCDHRHMGFSVLFRCFLCPDLFQFLIVLINYCSFIVSFEIESATLNLCFFFKFVLTILGVLHYHMNFRRSLSISAKNASWDFWRINLGSRAILTILSSFIASKNILYLRRRGLAHLVLTLFVIILFHAMANTIVFLISILGCSWLISRSTVDFCILILYPTTLLTSLIPAVFGRFLRIFCL